MNNFGKLAVKSAISGVGAGLVVGLILFAVSALIPGLEISAAVWGFWVGVSVAVISFIYAL